MMESHLALRNKIVLVPFPFDDLSSSKVRPPVCLTNAIGSYHHVVLAFITSRIPETPHASDIIIHHEDEDFEATGLRVSSAVRLHRMMTVSIQIIRRELGFIPPKHQAQIKGKLRSLFNLE